MKEFSVFIIVALTKLCYPQQLPLAIAPSSNRQQCGSLDVKIEDNAFEEINRVLNRHYGPEGGVCGGPEWQQILSVNMSKEDAECPLGWTKITEPIIACTRGNFRQAPIILRPTHSYSLVCGRVLAYQFGETDAFKASIEDNTTSLGDSYIDGVSLIYGPPNSRQHIWSFAAGASETTNGTKPIRNCPCSVENFPYELPDFIKSNYFCDSGNVGPSVSQGTLYSDRALWSGNGCHPSSRCCEFNSPPWFYSKLLNPTSEDMELAIMNSVKKTKNENVYVSIVDIYIQ